MSSAAMNWAFERIVPKLKDQVEKLVVLRLADRADPMGVCWPGHSRTAADLNVSLRAVQLAVRKLDKLGLLRIEERRGTSSKIFLNLGADVPAHLVESNQKQRKKKPTKWDANISPLAQTLEDEGVTPPGRSGFIPAGEAFTPKPLRESQKQPPQIISEVSALVELICWPNGLSQAQRSLCAIALQNVSADRAQLLVDELAGRMLRSTVHNPVGWLRKLVLIEGEGRLHLELAEDVANARSARVALAARLADGGGVESTIPLARPTKGSLLLSAAQIAGREAVRDQLARLKRETARRQI